MNKQTVLITGASSGIGLELSKLFAKDKNDLVLVARSEDKLESLARQLTSEHGINVTNIGKDLSNPNSPQEIFDELEILNISIDTLVNNAGFGAVGLFSKLSLLNQLQMIQVNCNALVNLTGLFYPSIKKSGKGGILNVASTAGFQPGPMMSVYYATKAFVLSFSEALYEEGNQEIKISCLCPGPTRTGFAKAAGMSGKLFLKLGNMDADQVARIGYRGFLKGKPIVITGFKNKVATFLVRFSPRILVRKVIKSIQK